MLKLKLQYFGQLMWRTDSFEKTLMLGKIEGRGEGDNRGWAGWMASPTRWTWVWVNSGSWWWTGRPGVLQFMGSQRVRHNWATELNWTDVHRSSVFFVLDRAFLSVSFMRAWSECMGLRVHVIVKIPCTGEWRVLEAYGLGLATYLYDLRWITTSVAFVLSSAKWCWIL